MKSKDLRGGVVYAIKERDSISPGMYLPSDVTYEEAGTRGRSVASPKTRFSPTFKGARSMAPSGLVLIVHQGFRYTSEVEVSPLLSSVTLDQALASLTDGTTPGLPDGLWIAGTRPANILKPWDEYIADEAADKAAEEASQARQAARTAKAEAEGAVIEAELARRGLNFSRVGSPVNPRPYSGEVKLTFAQARQLLGLDEPTQ